MNIQVNYESNFDYDNTLESLRNSNQLEYEISKGGANHQGIDLLKVKVKGFKKWCLIGKVAVQINFENDREKEHIFTLLRPHLRTKDNTLAFLKPTTTNVFANWKEVESGKPIPFSACPKTYLYTLQSIKTKLNVRKGVHPLLWFLLFLMLSLPVLPKFLELL
jgi:hypothetical protein